MPGCALVPPCLHLNIILNPGVVIPTKMPTSFRPVFLFLVCFSADWIRTKDTGCKSPRYTISQGLSSVWDLKHVLGSPSTTNRGKASFCLHFSFSHPSRLSVEEAITFFSKARFCLLCHICGGRPDDRIRRSQLHGSATNLVFHLVSKTNHVYFGFVWLCSLIGPENSRHVLKIFLKSTTPVKQFYNDDKQ